ncbi:hypothetical protein L553_2828 [Bordetella pertussis I036]|nr:hypothetical protein L564_2371 [Bordetella pertussis CHLA-15]ETH37472.1 hypothetical protein L547_2660 [Bordetella pertussis H918]ETH59288.1 hypothetical protein L553_2828 [Bordetella pertussis I036]ETH76134.1 hypothetical protein L555_2332 [Bordetella pertussis STO1-CHOC-0008]
MVQRSGACRPGLLCAVLATLAAGLYVHLTRPNPAVVCLVVCTPSWSAAWGRAPWRRAPSISRQDAA